MLHSGVLPPSPRCCCAPTLVFMSPSLIHFPTVPRLVVGRTGVGELAFLYPVDLRGLDLDKAVLLERGRFALYPVQPSSVGTNVKCTAASSRRRPPPGEGLNVPAIVTLRRMRVRDPNDRRAVEAFRGRLLAAALRMGGTFVHYDPDEGIWMLKIESY